MNIKKIFDDAIIPTRGSEYAAGYDLYAHIDNESGSEIILPHTTTKIHTGISISLPHNTFGAIFARSGLATKQGLRPANAVGVIDEDYTGELIVALHNDTDEERVVINKERIAQFVIIPYLSEELNVVDELEHTTRGDGGFGSTGN